MKALLFSIVIIAGVFCLAQDAPAQALAKEAAAETIRRHYVDILDWWQQEGCFLMLTSGGEVNQKLLARMKLRTWMLKRCWALVRRVSAGPAVAVPVPTRVVVAI